MSNAAAITTTLFAESALDGGSDALTESRWNEVYRLCRSAEEGVSLEAFANLCDQGQEGAVESIRNGHHPLLPAPRLVLPAVYAMNNGPSRCNCFRGY